MELYDLSRLERAGGEDETPIASGVSAATYTDGSLADGTEYFYRVQAVNAAGGSDLSSEASATPSASSAIDLALHQPIVASAVQDDNASLAAQYANDGDSTTRWSSDYAPAEWITVDLGSSRAITRVVINWEGSYSPDYALQTSNDDSTWQTVLTISDNRQAGVHQHLVSGNGRYLRVNSTAGNPTWNVVSILDLNVYGE